MKTVCTKLLSLMLVALLLVSAVPMAQAVTATEEYEVRLRVFDADETTLEKGLKVSLSADDLDMINEDLYDAEIAADLLDMAGSQHADKVTDENFRNIHITGKIITVWLKTAPEGVTPSTPGESGGAVKATLTVDPNNGGGTYSLEVTIGATYMSALASKTPAYPGATFVGWRSASKGTITEATVVEGNDTVTAIWETEDYFLTLDENREGEEYVTYGVTIAYNANVADRIAAYMPGGSKAPTREGYIFLGWKLGGKMVTDSTKYDYQFSTTAYAVWERESDTEGVPVPDGTVTGNKGKVYLEIYTNDNTSKRAEHIDITTYAADNKITRTEVEKVVKKYVTAKKGYTLKLIGLFDEENWMWYCNDGGETDGVASITVNREGDEYIYVMVNNVKTTTAPGSTNPKTGDYIFMSVTGLGLSATALVALYFFTKKRTVQ